MFFVDWWNSLTTVSQIFYCIAIPATLILLIQTILLFIGIGGEAEGADADIDGGDLDVEVSGDTADGVFGENMPEEAPDIEGFEGLRIFTIRGIVAFFVVFGWVGIVMESAGAPLYLGLPIAFVCGVAMMLALAFIFRALMKLKSNGNIDNRNAVGCSGKVYLTIPSSRGGEGKVTIMLQGVYVERDAVTDDDEPIKTGSEIVVVGTSGQTALVVKRK